MPDVGIDDADIKLEKHGWGFNFIFRESKVKGWCFDKDRVLASMVSVKAGSSTLPAEI